LTQRKDDFTDHALQGEGTMLRTLIGLLIPARRRRLSSSFPSSKVVTEIKNEHGSVKGFTLAVCALAVSYRTRGSIHETAPVPTGRRNFTAGMLLVGSVVAPEANHLGARSTEDAARRNSEPTIGPALLPPIEALSRGVTQADTDIEKQDPSTSDGASLMTQIPLSEAIQQIRDELREAILEGKDQEIVFTPNSIDVELGVSFSAEAKASGGFKLLAFLDVSGEAKTSRASQHKIKLSLSVTDKNGRPIKVRSETIRRGLPDDTSRPRDTERKDLPE
jgi:hypothetical protein